MENEYYQKLRKELETFLGLDMQTRRDYDRLSSLVKERTGDHLSATTLRRFWGYQEMSRGYEPAPHTLHLLSRMVGEENWTTFVERCKADAENGVADSSSFIATDGVLDADMLLFGDLVVVAWAPNRRVEVEYQGCEVFRVTASENSKLQPGDTFHCRQFVNGEPLYCRSLVRPGMATSDYYCGKKGGIHFTKI